MPRRYRKMRGGGFFDNVSNTLSGLGSSISNTTSGWFGSKKSTPSTSTYSTPPPSNTYTGSTAPMTTSTYGGRRRKSRKYMRGGYKDNTPTTGLAAHAAPFSGPTAQPHNWVGGKTRRRHRKGHKTRRHWRY